MKDYKCAQACEHTHNTVLLPRYLVNNLFPIRIPEANIKQTSK